MKDGFDKSVAEKMPRIQKKRPNRPWNVDPVLLKGQEHEEEKAPVELVLTEEVPVDKTGAVGAAAPAVEPVKAGPEAEVEKAPEVGARTGPRVQAKAEPMAAVKPAPPAKAVQAKSESIAKAVESIKELSSDFTQILFDRKEIQQQLEKRASSMDEVARENARLKANLASIEKTSLDGTMLEREIGFLNEQLEDADLYIQNMVGLLEEKMTGFEEESAKRKDLETRFGKVSREIQEKAKMDVKISILERDLTISSTRILDLESKLEEEYQKREPLEQEIFELKSALDKVYSSLAHIRLKAKREVYGS
jgi:chromosome segregation ATPase